MLVKLVKRVHCRNIRAFTISRWRASPLSYLQDIRQTKRFNEVKEFLHAANAPAFGKPSQASQPSICPTQPLVAVKVGIRDSLDSSPFSQIAIINTSTGQQKLVEAESRSHDSCPHWSPNGQQLAFLSDRLKPSELGVFIIDNAHLQDNRTSPVAAPALPGTPEALSWSADGSILLIRVAEHGADQAAVHGSDRLGSKDTGDGPSWLPTVQAGKREPGWRSLWIYEPNSRRHHRVGKSGLNIWEAAWLGQGRVLAVVSDSLVEDAWYETSLAVIEVETNDCKIIYRPKLQLGLPTHQDPQPPL